MKPELSRKIKALFEKYKYLMIIIFAGCLLLMLPDFTAPKSEPAVSSAETLVFSLENEEERIGKLLAKVPGIGKTEVILSLNSTMETHYQNDIKEGTATSDKNQESDSSSETVLISTGSGSQQPVVIKHVYPEYRGALIVCEGAGSSTVRLKVVEAIQSLTGLSADKITVLSRSTS